MVKKMRDGNRQLKTNLTTEMESLKAELKTVKDQLQQQGLYSYLAIVRT